MPAGKLWIRTNPTKPPSKAIPNDDDDERSRKPEWDGIQFIEKDKYNSDAKAGPVGFTREKGEITAEMRNLSKKCPWIAHSIAYYVNMDHASFALFGTRPETYVKFYPFGRSFYHRAESLLDGLLFAELKKLGRMKAVENLGNDPRHEDTKKRILKADYKPPGDPSGPDPRQSGGGSGGGAGGAGGKPGSGQKGQGKKKKQPLFPDAPQSSDEDEGNGDMEEERKDDSESSIEGNFEDESYRAIIDEIHRDMEEESDGDLAEESDNDLEMGIDGDLEEESDDGLEAESDDGFELESERPNSTPHGGGGGGDRSGDMEEEIDKQNNETSSTEPAPTTRTTPGTLARADERFEEEKDDDNRDPPKPDWRDSPQVSFESWRAEQEHRKQLEQSREKEREDTNKEVQNWRNIHKRVDKEREGKKSEKIAARGRRELEAQKKLMLDPTGTDPTGTDPTETHLTGWDPTETNLVMRQLTEPEQGWYFGSQDLLNVVGTSTNGLVEELSRRRNALIGASSEAHDGFIKNSSKGTGEMPSFLLGSSFEPPPTRQLKKDASSY